MKILGVATVFCSLCLAGCLAHSAGREMLSRQVNVFGIEFQSGVDYREIAGETGTDEPCLRGYERSFDRLGIAIGYGFDRRIRKITTRNPATSLFGVRPGMAAGEGARLLRQAGLTEGVSPRSYRGEGFTVTLLLDGAGTIFGITVEADE